VANCKSVFHEATGDKQHAFMLKGFLTIITCPLGWTVASTSSSCLVLLLFFSSFVLRTFQVIWSSSDSDMRWCDGAQLGKELRVSHQRISQLRASAMQRLSEQLQESLPHLLYA
jgi:hypothetical protein